MKAVLFLLLAMNLALSSCQDGISSVPVNVATDKTVITSNTNNPKLPKIMVPGLELKILAGSGEQGYQDGPALEATFNVLAGLAKDEEDNLYIADGRNHRIRKLSPEGDVSTLAGTGNAEINGNGSFQEIDIYSPRHLAYWPPYQLIVGLNLRNLYSLNLDTKHSELMVGTDTEVGIDASMLDLPFEIERLPFPFYGSFSTSMLVHDQKLYLARYGAMIEKTAAGYRFQYVIRNNQLLDEDGQPYLIFDPPCFADGPADQAAFCDFTDLGFDEKNNIYIADSGNDRIRKVDATTQAVSTVAGPGVDFLFRDGQAAEARLDSPFMLIVLGEDELLFYDNHRALRYLFQGQVRTLIRNLDCGDLLQDQSTLLISDWRKNQIYTLDLNSLKALQPILLKQELLHE